MGKARRNGRYIPTDAGLKFTNWIAMLNDTLMVPWLEFSWRNPNRKPPKEFTEFCEASYKLALWWAAKLPKQEFDLVFTINPKKESRMFPHTFQITYSADQPPPPEG